MAGRRRARAITSSIPRPVGRRQSDLTFVTVVAGHAWMAEVLAKAVLLRGAPLAVRPAPATARRRARDRRRRTRLHVGRHRRLSRRSASRQSSRPTTRAVARAHHERNPALVRRARGRARRLGAPRGRDPVGPRALHEGRSGAGPRPNWLLDMHRWLGGTALAFTGVHVVALLADQYMHFGLSSILIPLASKWHPVAVAWGIVAAYLLARGGAHLARAGPPLEEALARASTPRASCCS